MSRGHRLFAGIIVAALSSSLRAEEAPDVALADAEKRIQAHIDTIEGRQKEMEAHFIGRGDEIFVAAFQKHGVSAKALAERMKHLKGKVGMYLGAKSAQESVYTRYARILGAVLRLIQARGSADAGDLDYFDSRMADWRESEMLVWQHISAMLDFDARFAAVQERIWALEGPEHEEAREPPEDERFFLGAEKCRAERRLVFASTRQYFTGMRNVGDKRGEAKRIEDAAAKGLVLVPVDLAEKRLNALMLEMQVNLCEINYSADFWQFADHDRGRFYGDANAFMAWCGRNGHSYDAVNHKFDNVLAERLQQDFGNYHHQAVFKSLMAFRNSGEAKEKDIAYLEKGVKAWQGKSAKLKSSYWKIRRLCRQIAAKERDLAALDKRYGELHAAGGEAAEQFRTGVLEPANKRAEEEEGRWNKLIDAEYDTMFEIAFHVRLFREVPLDDDPTKGEAEGANVEENP